MSLTSELKLADSPISKFFTNFNFNSLIKEENLKLKACETILPDNQDKYPWSLVGHVTEYLIDLYLGVDIQLLFPMRYHPNKRDALYIKAANDYSQNKIINCFR